MEQSISWIKITKCEYSYICIEKLIVSQDKEGLITRGLRSKCECSNVFILELFTSQGEEGLITNVEPQISRASFVFPQLPP